MHRTIITIITIAALTALSACAENVDRQALSDAAVEQIVALNEQGIDPIGLGESELALLGSACVLIPIFRPAEAADIAAGCAVLREAAK